MSPFTPSLVTKFVQIDLVSLAVGLAACTLLILGSFHTTALDSDPELVEAAEKALLVP
jgi:hypothetical protein